VLTPCRYFSRQRPHQLSYDGRRCLRCRSAIGRGQGFGGAMLKEQKRNTNIGVGVAILLQVGARVLMNNGLSSLGYMVAVAAGVIFLWGCGQYAKGKGYSSWFGLFGLLYLLGLVVLVFFPDRHKNA
jgi:hypothetical protein